MLQEQGEDLAGHQDPAVTTKLNQVLAGVTVRRAEIGPQNLINFSILIRNFTQVKPSWFPVYDACTAPKNTAHNCFRLAPRKAEHRDCSLADRCGDRCNCVFQGHIPQLKHRFGWNWCRVNKKRSFRSRLSGVCTPGRSSSQYP